MEKETQNRLGLKIVSLILSVLSSLRFLWDMFLEMSGCTSVGYT